MNHHALVFAVTVLALLAFRTASADNLNADSLLDLKGVANTKKTLAVLEQACEREPQNYNLLWQASSACRNHAAAIKHRGHKGWKKQCAVLGKKGMAFAEKAMTLAPGRVEGYFYFAAAVSAYSDGVSVITALKEGLKGKTQNSLEKAYTIDKTYKDGGPAFALGRFWAVVPWPYQDRKKAMLFYREYQKLNKNGAYWEERHLDIAEFLMDMGKEHRAETKRILQKLAESHDAYVAKKAGTCLEKIEKR